MSSYGQFDNSEVLMMCFNFNERPVDSFVQYRTAAAAAAAMAAIVTAVAAVAVFSIQNSVKRTKPWAII